MAIDNWTAVRGATEAGSPTPKPRFRGRIHQAAFFISVPLGGLLVVAAHGSAQRVAAAVYAFSLAAMFGTSALYHRGRWRKAWRSRMQRLDHAMIFVHIAGSYAPVVLIALRDAWVPAFLILACGVAVLGISLSLVQYEFVERHERAFYIGFGWLIVVALPWIYAALPAAKVLLLIAGGVTYTVGAIMFVAERPDPRPLTFGYHEVWHAMTVLAAGFHCALVFELAHS